MKLYSASYGELDPFNLFDTTITVNTPADLHSGGVLILWGGEDIGTELYHEKPNKYVHSAPPSARDKKELALIQHAILKEIPIIGICRGAQLLCVAAGGTLAQHIEEHGWPHFVTLHDEDDTLVECNSSHHQMMLPPTSAKVLASADRTTGINQYNEAVVHEQVNEVVYFPTINALGIQPHPEWRSCSPDFVAYCIRKIKEYLL